MAQRAKYREHALSNSYFNKTTRKLLLLFNRDECIGLLQNMNGGQDLINDIIKNVQKLPSLSDYYFDHQYASTLALAELDYKKITNDKLTSIISKTIVEAILVILFKTDNQLILEQYVLQGTIRDQLKQIHFNQLHNDNDLVSQSLNLIGNYKIRLALNWCTFKSTMIEDLNKKKYHIMIFKNMVNYIF